MEWVSVCLLPVFVPSGAGKVGKFPRWSGAAAELLPRRLVGVCLLGNAEFEPPDSHLHRSGDFNQLAR